MNKTWHLTSEMAFGLNRGKVPKKVTNADMTTLGTARGCWLSRRIGRHRSCYFVASSDTSDAFEWEPRTGCKAFHGICHTAKEIGPKGLARVLIHHTKV